MEAEDDGDTSNSWNPGYNTQEPEKEIGRTGNLRKICVCLDPSIVEIKPNCEMSFGKTRRLAITWTSVRATNYYWCEKLAKSF